jgi:hypothetical protein
MFTIPRDLKHKNFASESLGPNPPGKARRLIYAHAHSRYVIYQGISLVQTSKVPDFRVETIYFCFIHQQIQLE